MPMAKKYQPSIMTNKRNILLYISLLFISVFNSNAQDAENDAINYFNQYLNNKDQFDLITKSLPTLEQCKVVFKDDFVSTYYDFASKLDKRLKIEISKLDYEEHAGCKIDSWNTNDLKTDNSSYNGGMDEYMHVLKPNIIFYRLTYLFENGSQSHDSIYKFFVNIDGNWIFFANPGIIFGK